MLSKLLFLASVTSLVLFTRALPEKTFSCYRDICDRVKQYCHEPERRCYHCADTRAKCGDDSMPRECDAYCLDVQLKLLTEKYEKTEQALNEKNSLFEDCRERLQIETERFQNERERLQNETERTIRIVQDRYERTQLKLHNVTNEFNRTSTRLKAAQKNNIAFEYNIKVWQGMTGVLLLVALIALIVAVGWFCRKRRLRKNHTVLTQKDLEENHESDEEGYASRTTVASAATGARTEGYKPSVNPSEFVLLEPLLQASYAGEGKQEGKGDGNAHTVTELSHHDPFVESVEETAVQEKADKRACSANHHNTRRPTVNERRLKATKISVASNPLHSSVSDDTPGLHPQPQSRGTTHPYEQRRGDESGQYSGSEDPRSDDPRIEDPRAKNPRAEDPRAENPRAEDPRTKDPIAEDPRTEDPRALCNRLKTIAPTDDGDNDKTQLFPS